ncbi:hypothetical protein G2W53_017549 [Senna tora]|uniref:Uncharacterized protein n=1 Tax=Senna tora TaxID=362788 RepID=A0A834WKA7_9FABA|nr:hypothetical protein G2W53_017549 [Senna tora]
MICTVKKKTFLISPAEEPLRCGPEGTRGADKAIDEMHIGVELVTRGDIESTEADARGRSRGVETQEPTFHHGPTFLPKVGNNDVAPTKSFDLVLVVAYRHVADVAGFGGDPVRCHFFDQITWELNARGCPKMFGHLVACVGQSASVEELVFRVPTGCVGRRGRVEVEGVVCCFYEMAVSKNLGAEILVQWIKHTLPVSVPLVVPPPLPEFLRKFHSKKGKEKSKNSNALAAKKDETFKKSGNKNNTADGGGSKGNSSNLNCYFCKRKGHKKAEWRTYKAWIVEALTAKFLELDVADSSYPQPPEMPESSTSVSIPLPSLTEAFPHITVREETMTLPALDGDPGMPVPEIPRHHVPFLTFLKIMILFQKFLESMNLFKRFP